jgi:hypothetical protein
MTNRNVVSVNPVIAGKRYVEVVCDVISAQSFIGITSDNPANSSNGVSDNGIALSTLGDYYEFGSFINTPAAALSAGDVIGFAVNFDTQEAWISVNGVWLTGDPATDTDPISVGSLVPATTYYVGATVSTSSTGTLTLTLHNHAGQFTYPVPSGFSPWWP